MGRGRSAFRNGYVARLSRPVAPSDTSIWVDTDPVIAPPFYMTINPLGTTEIIYVETVNVGTGEWEFTNLTRNLPGTEDQTHLTNQFVMSAYTADAHDDIWDEVTILQGYGYRQIAAADSPYTMVKTDQIVSCWYDSGPIVVNLPTGAESVNQGVLIQSFGAFAGSNTTTIIAPSALIFTDGIGVSQKILSGPGTLWSGYNVGTGDDWSTTGERGSIS